MTDKWAQEVEEIDAEVARLEAEKAGLPPVPTWEELQDSDAVAELERRESRRGVLPHLIRAGKIKKLGLRSWSSGGRNMNATWHHL